MWTPLLPCEVGRVLAGHTHSPEFSSPYFPTHYEHAGASSACLGPEPLWTYKGGAGPECPP